MQHLIRHIRSLLVAVTALALSAGLAFGSTPEAASWGLANAASHAGKVVPVGGGAEDALGEGEDTDEETDEEIDEETEEDAVEDETDAAGENCATDPTVATEEELAELKHGSIVCWAAHQAEWPEWFDSHGAWVRCWAHHGKADAASCTEDPEAEEPTTEEPSLEEPTVEATGVGSGNGKGNGNGKGKSKPNRH